MTDKRFNTEKKIKQITFIHRYPKGSNFKLFNPHIFLTQFGEKFN